ncbi:MAG: SDR family NAD(P)-dependent oxidoreductase [Beijerinckiaceae bacterium]
MNDATNATRPATLITGASSGIGRALALEAAKEGCVLALVARSAEALSQLADEIRTLGGEAHAIALDITEPAAPQQIANALMLAGLHVETLVNNAGVGHLGMASQIDPEKQLVTVDLNIRAMTALTLRFLPDMMARGQGGILNVGSVAGFLPGPGMAVYYASKAYVRSFSEALWEEARRAGVTVSCLAPGPVETPFLAKAGVGKSQLFKTMRHMDAATCARIGWAGYRARKRMITPDMQSSLTAALAPFIPRRLLLIAMRRLQKARAKVG